MRILYIVILSFFVSASTAQVNFVKAGSISYERRISQFAALGNSEDDSNMWMEELKKQFPKVVADNFTLQFNSKESFYYLTKENPDNKYINMLFKPSETNYVNQKHETGTVTSAATIFENTYLVNDSLVKYEWKITGEVRDIAGFECKKAVTKICDSVVVVAFYTDQIPVQAGPENFNGLPGMILGIAVPRLGTTIFATSISLQAAPNYVLPTLSKPKKSTIKQLDADLLKTTKDWGKEAAAILWFLKL
jgi:GLPGLI family protein